MTWGSLWLITFTWHASVVSHPHLWLCVTKGQTWLFVTTFLQHSSYNLLTLRNVLLDTDIDFPFHHSDWLKTVKNSLTLRFSSENLPTDWHLPNDIISAVNRTVFETVGFYWEDIRVSLYIRCLKLLWTNI